MPYAFDRAFAFTVGVEGSTLDLDPDDNGNWTGGEKGIGVLKGSRYGISASSYPDENIANMTLTRAKMIYLRDFWNRVTGDMLPVSLACIVFDGAVNSGVKPSSKWLQQAVGVYQDGSIGTNTRAAVKVRAATLDGLTLLCRDTIANRAQAMPSMAGWQKNSLGWMRRIVSLSLLTAELVREV